MYSLEVCLSEKGCKDVQAFRSRVPLQKEIRYTAWKCFRERLQRYTSLEVKSIYYNKRLDVRFRKNEGRIGQLRDKFSRLCFVVVMLYAFVKAEKDA